MEKECRFTEKELWEKYLMLTKELLKFIDQQEIDMFLELVDQRQTVMEWLQAIEKPEYGLTPEAEAIRNEIKPMDMQIMYKAKTWLNKSRRTNMAVRSYDITGYSPAGNVFNKGF